MRLLLVEDSRTAVKMVEGLLAEEEERRDFRFDLSVARSLSEAQAALSAPPSTLSCSTSPCPTATACTPSRRWSRRPPEPRWWC